jgi:hypothetical protein
LQKSVVNEGQRHGFAQSTRLALTFSCVATFIPNFVSFKVRTADAFGRLGFLATLWHLALGAVYWMEATIYVALEFRSGMKPRDSATEDVAGVASPV